MTKDDKAKLAAAWQSYKSAAAQCSNVLYNLSQRTDKDVSNYGELVRNHDAARHSLDETLKRFRLISLPEGAIEMTISQSVESAAPERNWRSNKASAAIHDAAELIANCYCSDDDTFYSEVARLEAAITKAVNSHQPTRG
jgi:hypothetical protein